MGSELSELPDSESWLESESWGSELESSEVRDSGSESSESWSEMEVSEFPESESELSELGSELELESETSETGVTLAYLVYAWGLGLSLTL